MSGIELNLDREALAQLVHEQFINSLGEEGRREVIGDAIKVLTGVDKSGRRTSYNESPLEYAFKKHIQTIADEVVKEIVDSDPTVREKIKAVTTKAIHEFLDNDETSKAMASLLVQQFVSAKRR